MAFSLGDIFISIMAKTDGLKSGMADVQNFANGVQNAGNTSSGSMAKAVAVGTLLADGIKTLAAQTIQFGKSAIDSAGDFEQYRVAFETMLGSGEKAQQMLTDISAFAKTTPFELPEVVTASKQLLAFGVAQKDILPTMSKLGDVAAGVGVPVGQLSYVYGQVRLTGKLMAQDLMQFTNAGVPMLDYLAQVTHKTTAQIKADMDRGVGPSFEQVQQALDLMTTKGSKFGGMMSKQSMTFKGVMSNISDGFGQLLRAAVGMDSAGNIVAGSFFDRVKTAAMTFMPVIQDLATKVGPWMTQALQNLDQVTASVFATFRDFAQMLWGVFGPSLLALWNTLQNSLWPSLVNLWDLMVRLKPLWEAIGFLLGAFIVAAIWLLINVVNILIKTFSVFLDIYVGVYNFIIDSVMAIVAIYNWLASAVKIVLDLIIGYWQFWFNVVSYIFAVFRGLAIAIFQAIADYVRPVTNAISGAFQGAFNYVTGLWGGIANWFQGIWNRIAGGAGGLGGAMANGFSGAFNTIKGIAIGAINWMIDKINTVINAVNGSAGKLPGVPKVPNIARLFKGFNNWLGGAAIVGEHGPELIELPRGANVRTANETRQLANGIASGGGGGVNIAIDMSGSFLSNSADGDRLAERLGDSIIRRMVSQARISM